MRSRLSREYYTTRPNHSPSLSVKRKLPPPSKRPLPRCNFHFNTTTVYYLHSTYPTWITAATTSDSTKILQFQHPLTLKPQPWNLPTDFNLSKFKHSKIAVSYHTSDSFDKLLVFPKHTASNPNYDDHTLVVLSKGGKLRGQSPSAATWVSCSSVDLFDDIIIFRGKIHALDRDGNLYIVTVNSKRVTIGKPIIDRLVTPVSKHSGWRKRLVTDESILYAVVRVEDDVLQVYKTHGRERFGAWVKDHWFSNSEMLYMSKDYHFFRSAGKYTNMSKYENCIVSLEGAFPKYGDGNDSWEFSDSEDHIAVFRLSGETFARVGENEEFSKLDWSPPPWIFQVPSESSESCSQSQSESEEDEDLDSNSEDENDEEMESESKSQDEEDGQMQCGLKSHEKEDEEMYSSANIEGVASLQEDISSSLFGREFETSGTVTASVLAAKDIARTILNMNGGNDAAEQGTSMKNMTQSVPGTCTSSTTKSNKSDSVTSKFEGFDVRSDPISTLQKIWQKHGNIIENSTIRSGGILARALESLAIVIQILNDNTAESLSDSQADCLRLTLSDLRCMCFKVDWLVPYVEKAVKLHKSKPLLDSFNSLSQLSSQVKERRTILFDELAKLGEEENKLKEEMAKLSKMIPISDDVKFDEPLGLGLI